MRARARVSGADVSPMKTIQVIELDGRLAAVVAGDQAIIADHVTGADRARVQAKALYALQIQSGERPGSYSDEGAEHHARTIAAQRDSGTRRGDRRRARTRCR